MFIVVAVDALREIVFHQLLYLLLVQMPAVVIIEGTAGCRIWSSCTIQRANSNIL